MNGQLPQKLPVNGFKWKKNVSKFDENLIKNYDKDSKKGYVLIIEVKIENEVLLLINLYNANTGNEKKLMILVIKALYVEEILICYLKLIRRTGRKPCTEQKSLAKLIQIKEKFDLCDIWRIRNSNTKHYTFREQHSCGYIQKRLDYFFISNVLQESVKNFDVLAAFLTDHSIMFSLFSKSEGMRVKICGNITTLYARKVHTLRA